MTHASDSCLCSVSVHRERQAETLLAGPPCDSKEFVVNCRTTTSSKEFSSILEQVHKSPHFPRKLNI